MSPADSPTDARPVFTARGLRKSFGGVDVLRGIDLEVRRGEVVALIGPSGSGKTTLLRSLNSLEVPDGGTVELADGSVLDFDRGVGRKALTGLRDRSAMVFQHFNLFPHLTVLQNVTEGPLRVQRLPASEVIAEAERLLERVGLGGRGSAYPFELSGGQQQRVGIVRALALRPELLLFDEPTSALDPELVGDVLSLMRELAGEGWTMLVVTHELEFARQVASEVVFMAGGVVVERGAPAQILREPREPRTRQFLHRLLHPLD
ncbi:amino acid ABC transporter ATP-binding protein [Rathayibacter rathayi]|uniref:Amino acid ABC transporter ATP-binding protein n=1 Tax=Rathayibacter rathayi TaxID=33887 RepID=A0ABD6W793_RATRA|nr:amino acid ABC transporter ATP-binding protein [Rathayibacter rathayi]AZZ48035.1 amino acid ABC transporter ATP-binding protein [Rathayibacter rathayi]MWV74688.1 ATP-binding cassette domain-containing protein [Rathayibacter rathayi NCPPB 2980 = VKM Ac-1601]PPF12438.1 amino acid ABC transporter ATP-binding protein [Rathayibacter rathayi]PPF25904.1 amino acid ABC transporter ATP-binding protein [Rathayibacter rathayi]PPF50525.1 amino acid ABC transporter ATP-binding protein [Rathayibacter rat